MKLLLPIFAMVCTVLATLTALVFCMAGGANSTPAQIRALKLWMLGLTLLGVAGITVGIFLLRAGQPGWAAGVSFAPVVIMSLILMIALLK
ncbi:MAG: hypothetical protein AAB370_10500 [Verrucomicrobiota bacterium]